LNSQTCKTETNPFLSSTKIPPPRWMRCRTQETKPPRQERLDACGLRLLLEHRLTLLPGPTAASEHHGAAGALKQDIGFVVHFCHNSGDSIFMKQITASIGL
jgi:hypothetical protein